MIRLYPEAKVADCLLENGVGPLIPKGITIHYTAGGTAASSISHLRTTNLRYHIVIDRDGSVYQLVPFDRKVNHAGKAEWNELSPNSHHVAIALANWGKVDYTDGQYHTWAKQRLLPELVAYRPFNVREGMAYWEVCNNNQESVLIDVIAFLVRHTDIEPKNICGHDESTSRKIDPGGSLSFPMEKLRNTAESFL